MVTNLTGRAYDISRMALGTVHAICQSLTTDRRFSSGTRQKAPVLMDELSQYFKIYHRIFWQRLIEAGGFPDEESTQRTINHYLSGNDAYSRHQSVLNCIQLFNRFSEECLHPSVVQTNEETLAALLKMYQYYLDELNNPETQIKTVDFSLLQQAAYHTILRRSTAQPIFKHVIIDEYQDTNAIQELIFFELAKGCGNICVVGDDDQALYRFRGATVENLVEFETRCEKFLRTRPVRIDLDVNYRSKKKIVEFFTDFIRRTDWKKADGTGFYRVADKQIRAVNQEEVPAVLATGKKAPTSVYAEIAGFIKQLKELGKIQDYNQAAFLFPALKNNTRVQGFKAAFEQLGIQVYAPRTCRFLEVPEAMMVYGLFFIIFGRPSHQGHASQGLRDFRDWTLKCIEIAERLIGRDPMLAEYVRDRQAELQAVVQDYAVLMQTIEKKKWDVHKAIKPEMVRMLVASNGLSVHAQKTLTNHYFLEILEKNAKIGKPFPLQYIINRATSLDWSILDLFFQLNGFKYFQELYRLAENGQDEGPVCNLGLLTQYLARFMEEYSPILTGNFLFENRFIHVFFSSFTYAIFRLNESEYEDVDDPFPKGRVPFLTIHQAKCLEFPVVVLGSLYKMERKPDAVEVVIRELLSKSGEPLDRIGYFDNMRMFYVGLSRAQNLMILPHFFGRGQSTSEPFKCILEENQLPQPGQCHLAELSVAQYPDSDLGRTYSYTGDYLAYLQCPRHYMLFKKYGFIPSRSQTMFFGNLVHQTIEDLHHLLIQERRKAKETSHAG